MEKFKPQSVLTRYEDLTEQHEDLGKRGLKASHSIASKVYSIVSFLKENPDKGLSDSDLESLRLIEETVPDLLEDLQDSDSDSDEVKKEKQKNRAIVQAVPRYIRAIKKAHVERSGKTPVPVESQSNAESEALISEIKTISSEVEQLLQATPIDQKQIEERLTRLQEIKKEGKLIEEKLKEEGVDPEEDKDFRRLAFQLKKIEQISENASKKIFEEWKSSFHATPEYSSIDSLEKKAQSVADITEAEDTEKLVSQLVKLLESQKRVVKGNSHLDSDRLVNEYLSDLINRLEKTVNSLKTFELRKELSEVESMTSQQASQEGQASLEERKHKIEAIIQKLKSSGFDISSIDLSALQKLDSFIEKNTVSQETSITLEVLRKKSLLDLLKSWHTNDLNSQDEPRLALEIAFGEKLDALKSEMVTSEDPEEREKQEKKWKAFSELYEQVYGLIWFGIFNSKSMNKKDLTAKEEELFKAAGIDGALKSNVEFNRNPLVGAEDLDDEEFSPNMGIVQKIVYAAYQEMKKKGEFYRGKGWAADTVDKLLDKVCSLEQIQPERSASGKKGSTQNINIKSELETYPKEVREIIRFIALLKLCRDNLGFKAGVWHLGRNKAAFKFSGGGTGRPEGLLASILYQVGKNSARENHAACLAFIDPSQTEMMEDNTDQDREVLRMNAEYENFFVNWFHPNWKKIRFQKFTPKHWDDDFPGLDHFFNQTQEVVGPEDYTKSRDAVLNIIEKAAASPLITLPTNQQQLEERVRTAVKAISSEIAKAGSYIGLGTPPLRKDFPDDATFQEATKRYHEFIPMHELILAATQYFLANILIAVPGDIARVRIFSNYRDSEYDILFKAAVKTIRDTLELNTSLKGYYHDNILHNGFLNQDGFKRTWRDEDLLRNTFHRWREGTDPRWPGVVNDPAADPKNRGIFTRQQMYIETPKNPVHPSDKKDGVGWKSSFEAASS